MNSFKIKLLISVLGGIVFSLIFILLALVVPLKNEKEELINLDKPVATAAQLAAELKKQ